MSDLDTAAPGADTGAATTSKGTDAPSREGGAPATTDRALVTTDTDDVGDDGDNSDLFPAGGDTDAVENDSEQAPGGERQDDAALPAWHRPEGLDEQALAEWKEAQGLPVSAEDYEGLLELPEGTEITEAGRQIVGSFLHFATDNDLPAPVVSKAIAWFNDTQRAVIKERDSVSKKEAQESLRERWEDAYDDNLAVATAGLKTLPEPLQKLLRSARGPDGRKLLHDPDMAQVLFDLGARHDEGDGTRADSSADARESAKATAALRKELKDIHALRDKDRDAYWRNWRDTKMTAHDRALEIRDLLAKPAASPSAQRAAQAAERASLEALRTDDPEVFEHGRWRGGRQTPAERLDDIRTGRA